MPRSGGGRSGGGGGRRPAPAPAPSRPAQQPQQQRGMTTTANPSRTQQPQAQTGQSPGLFGQMASTAAGVAVGSSIGHAISGFFGGGGSSASEAAPQAQSYDSPQSYDSNSYAAQPMDQGLYNSSSNSYQQQQGAGPCAADAAKFTMCFDKTGGDMGACGYYLEQLKACQQAARSYTQ